VRIARAPHERSPLKREALLLDPYSLPCGCTFPPPAGAAKVDLATAIFLCRDARALEATAHIAAAFAAAAPADPFFARLAVVTREAFDKHLRGRWRPNLTVPARKTTASRSARRDAPVAADDPVLVGDTA
jgi:hypothetical protein